jgi:site-specific recombinase XerD
VKERPNTPRSDRANTPRPPRLTAPEQLVAREVRLSDVLPPCRPSAGTADLRRAVSRWLGDGKAQGWSPNTLRDRKSGMERFLWWLEHEEKAAPTLAALEPAAIRSFLAYAREPNERGRFGSIRYTAKREARPATVHAYFRMLRAFSSFCLAEGLLEAAEWPLKNVKAPRVPNDQIQPLTPDQVQAIVNAARSMQAPARNVALIMVLVDTGLRVSELMGLKVGDVDRGEGELLVTGKGNKKRRVYMGSTARRALWRYFETDRRTALTDEPLFVSVGGTKHGAALSHTGVHGIVTKAGAAAGVTGIRCSPHTLRHTFAVNFLRGGGNLFELQQLMGHTDLTVLRRYVALAEADLAQAHRNASPADRMRLK